MFTVTVSTDSGETITSTSPAAIEQRLREWLEPTDRWDRALLRDLRKALDAERVHDAGQFAHLLGFNFAWSPKLPSGIPEHFYVPVDPADATICEACE